MELSQKKGAPEFSNSISEIYYDAKLKMIELIWTKDYTDEEFKETLLAGLEIAQKHGAVNWIADTRNFRVLSATLLAWNNEVWWPKANHSSLKKVALIIPESVLGAMSLDQKKFQTGNLSLNNVQNREEAIYWFQEK